MIAKSTKRFGLALPQYQGVDQYVEMKGWGELTKVPDKKEKEEVYAEVSAGEAADYVVVYITAPPVGSGVEAKELAGDLVKVKSLA